MSSTEADGSYEHTESTSKSNGKPRREHIASYRCVADPDRHFLGRYFFAGEFDASLTDGVMPTGSLWLNDHSLEVFEVDGEVGEHQQLVRVGEKRLRLLEARFPRLRRALSNPQVS